MIFSRKRQSPRQSFLEEAALGASFRVIDPKDTFFAMPEDSIDYAAGSDVLTDGLGAALGLLRKAKDWVSVQVNSELMKKIEAVSPDILFDLEKKIEFAGITSRYLVLFADWYVASMTRWKELVDQDQQDEANRVAASIINGILSFIDQVREYHHDYAHCFSHDIYDRYREKLNTLSISDRRSIEVFYSRFTQATAVLGRIFNQEIPDLMGRDAITTSHVAKWLTQITDCISMLHESAMNMLGEIRQSQ